MQFQSDTSQEEIENITKYSILSKIVLLVDDQGYLLQLILNNDKVDTKKVQAMQKEINCLEVVTSNVDSYRILTGVGSEIYGFTKEHRNYFKTNMQSADIIRICILEGQSFFTAGEYMMNEYKVINDKFMPSCFFLSPDKINCMQVHYLSKLNVILGCQDSCIRVLEKDQILYIMQVTSPVICMNIFSPNINEINKINKQDQRRCFIYGLEDGTIFAADMGMEKSTTLFTIQTESISCLTVLDYQGKGVSDIAICRNDGLLEIYNQEGEQLSQRKLNEKIIGIESGYFQQSNQLELLVLTYSGRLLILKEQQTQLFKDEKKIIKEQEVKFKQLQREVEELQSQLQGYKQKGEIVSINKFKLNVKLLIKQNVTAIIDCQYPIQLITIQTDIPIERRCIQIQDTNIRNYEIPLNLKEGIQGELTFYVQPQGMMVAQSFQTEIKCLSLHQSINLISIKHLQLNTLSFKGNFSKADMNLWLNQLVPDLPPSDDDTVCYLLRNNFTDTYLQIKFKQGSALFKSDSLLTIQISKQFIVQQANKRGIQIEVKWESNEDSIRTFIQKMKVIHEQYKEIEQKYQIIPALKEISIEFNDISKDMKAILDNEQEITKQFAELPRKLKYLEDLISDLYVASNSMKSLNTTEQQLETVKVFWNKDINQLLSYIIK
ncbi:hypothetical protein pb186bvf_016186 [Paramecium bursaria]